MNKILIPFDFSVYAENALDYAIEVAKHIKASVTVFHVFDVPVPAGYEDASLTYNMALANQEQQKIEKKLNGLLSERMDSYYPGTTNKLVYDIAIRQSDLEGSIKSFLSHNHFNMVIMGTKGSQGWDALVKDSNTVSVSDLVSIPLLVVPLEARFEGISQTVYASNFDKKDSKVLQSVSKFNEFFEGKVICLHVDSIFNNGAEALAKADQLKARTEALGMADIKFEVVQAESVEQGLFGYAEDAEADLLVVMPQERDVLSSLFHRSVTKQLTHHCRLPLLILK